MILNAYIESFRIDEGKTLKKSRDKYANAHSQREVLQYFPQYFTH